MKPVSELFNNIFAIPDLKTRTFIEEAMDSPACDKKKLQNTLIQFTTINRFFSKIQRVLEKTLLLDMKRRGLKTVTIAEVGSGSCETADWFTRKCLGSGIEARIFCFDINNDTIAFAKNRYARNKNLVFIHESAMNIGDFDEPLDYCYSSHFLHHLQEDQIVKFLEIINGKVRYCSVHNDILRNPLWYFGFSVFGTLFFHNSLALKDGRISICNGFKMDELKQLVNEAGIGGNSVVMKNHIGHACILINSMSAPRVGPP